MFPILPVAGCRRRSRIVVAVGEATRLDRLVEGNAFGNCAGRFWLFRMDFLRHRFLIEEKS